MQAKHADQLILIVDDEDVLVEMLCEVLLESGYRVLTARNGRVALELIQQQRPSLILSDAMMPGMSGMELYERLQVQPRYQGIPFLLMSAVAYPQARLRYQAVPFISKPFDLITLLDMVEQMLESAR